MVNAANSGTPIVPTKNDITCELPRFERMINQTGIPSFRYPFKSSKMRLSGHYKAYLISLWQWATALMESSMNVSTMAMDQATPAMPNSALIIIK